MIFKIDDYSSNNIIYPIFLGNIKYNDNLSISIHQYINFFNIGDRFLSPFDGVKYQFPLIDYDKQFASNLESCLDEYNAIKEILSSLKICGDVKNVGCEDKYFPTFFNFFSQKVYQEKPYDLCITVCGTYFPLFDDKELEKINYKNQINRDKKFLTHLKKGGLMITKRTFLSIEENKKFLAKLINSFEFAFFSRPLCIRQTSFIFYVILEGYKGFISSNEDCKIDLSIIHNDVMFSRNAINVAKKSKCSIWRMREAIIRNKPQLAQYL